MLRRVLYLFAAAYLVVFLLRLILSGHRKLESRRRNRRQDAEDMVLDPQCGSYLPAGDAIVRKGRHFCSEECARLYLKG